MKDRRRSGRGALLVMVLFGSFACRRASETHPGPQPPGGPNLLAVLNEARAKHRDLIFAAVKRGIVALTPRLDHVAWIARRKAGFRHLRVGPRRRSLYFWEYGTRQLKKLSLVTRKETLLATLPPFRRPCLFPDVPSVNPLDFVQQESDLEIDFKTQILCIAGMDRNENMASARINYRVSLGTGTVDSRITMLNADGCKEMEAKSLCTPVKGFAEEVNRADFRHPAHGKEATVKARISPSGTWVYFADHDLGTQQDYIYGAAFLYNTKNKKTFAILPGRTKPVDFSGVIKANRRPEDTCLIPSEARVSWLGNTDVLILEGCLDDRRPGTAVIQPPATIRRIEARHFALF